VEATCSNSINNSADITMTVICLFLHYKIKDNGRRCPIIGYVSGVVKGNQKKWSEQRNPIFLKWLLFSNLGSVVISRKCLVVWLCTTGLWTMSLSSGMTSSEFVRRSKDHWEILDVGMAHCYCFCYYKMKYMFKWCM
jgi:hypothetical protein